MEWHSLSSCHMLCIRSRMKAFNSSLDYLALSFTYSITLLPSPPPSPP